MVDAGEMGKLSYVVTGLQSMGIPLHVISVLPVMIVFFSLKGIALYGSQIYRIYLQESLIRKIRLNLLRGRNQLSFKSFVTSDAARIQHAMTVEVDRGSRRSSSYLQTFPHG